MLIGIKRQRVQLRQPSRTVTALGDITSSWSNYGSPIWASIEPLRGEELYAAQQVQAEVTHKIRLRYSTDVANLNPKDQVIYGLRTFEILAVLNLLERNRELELLCKERVGTTLEGGEQAGSTRGFAAGFDGGFA